MNRHLNRHMFAGAFLGVAVYELVGIEAGWWPTLTAHFTNHPVLGAAVWGAVIFGVTAHLTGALLDRRRHR